MLRELTAGPVLRCKDVDVSDRSFPFVPMSSADVELGDVIAVPCKHGWGVLQVNSLASAEGDEPVAIGVGALPWGGSRPPSSADIAGEELSVYGWTTMEIFTEGGVQVVDIAPLAQTGPRTHTTEREVWSWRRALKMAHDMARLHAPQEPPLELENGRPRTEHVWMLSIEHTAPGAAEPTAIERKARHSMLELETRISEYMAENGGTVTRSVHFFDSRMFHLADGSTVEFWWRLYSHDWGCKDCGMDCFDEYYFVHDDLWDRANYPDMDGLLCIGCLEARLGRQLVGSDFKANRLHSAEAGVSPRFIDRLNAH